MQSDESTDRVEGNESTPSKLDNFMLEFNERVQQAFEEVHSELENSDDPYDLVYTYLTNLAVQCSALYVGLRNLEETLAQQNEDGE